MKEVAMDPKWKGATSNIDSGSVQRLVRILVLDIKKTVTGLRSTNLVEERGATMDKLSRLIWPTAKGFRSGTKYEPVR